MRKATKKSKAAHVVAILCGDLHLRDTVPLARGESRSEWYYSQARYIEWLVEQSTFHNAHILCAGDVLHKWNSPPELINFLHGTNLRGMISVAGNHDLPNHSMQDMSRSGYQTLVDLNVIDHANNELEGIINEDIYFQGVSCGETLNQNFPSGLDPEQIKIAIVHDMVWKTQAPFPGVPQSKSTTSQAILYEDFDVVLFGDNHSLVTDNLDRKNPKKPVIVNCGCFMPTRADEQDKGTYVGLLFSDKTVQIVPIPEEIASQNKWREDDDLNDSLIVNGVSHSLEDFLETVRDLSDVSLNFHDAIRRYLKIEKPTTNVRDRLMAIIDEIEDK